MRPSVEAAEKSPAVEWSLRAGGTGVDIGSGAAVDSAGNVYLASWHGTVARVADKEIPARSLALSKMDSTGKLLWLKSYPDLSGTVKTTFVRLLVDTNDNLLAGLTSAGARYALGTETREGTTFAKFDPEGNILWSEGQGTGSEMAPTAALSPDGNHLFFARINGGFQYGNSQISGGEADLLALKVKPNGELMWTRRGIGPRNSEARAIAADAESQVYLGGTFQGSIAFGQLSTNNLSGSTDGFVTKLDENGQPLWMMDFRGDANVRLGGIAVLSDGNIAVCGFFENSLNLGAQKVPGSGAFLGRIDSDGSFQAVYKLGERLVPSDLLIGRDGELILAGTFSGTTILAGNSITTRGGKDYLLAKMSATAGIRWVKPFGYVADETFDPQVALSAVGETYVALTVREGLIIDNLFLESSGGEDAAIIKLQSPEKPLPVVLEMPQPQAALVGGAATFSVTATNGLRYQWFFNNTAIPGATNAIYTVQNVTIASSGSYSVAVSNDAGTTRSAPANLTVSGEIAISVSTLAGRNIPGYVDSTNQLAVRFNQPKGLGYWAAGAIAVADTSNHVVRLVNAEGATVTFAGNAAAGYINAPSLLAAFRFPSGIAVDNSTDLLVADTENHVIRRISTIGLREVSTLAGRPLRGYRDGRAGVAQFNGPNDLVTDASGNIFVTDSLNHAIRRISADGLVTTFAGNGTAGFVDGTGTNALFNMPFGIAIDSQQNLFVTESTNHTIRRITPDGAVTTLAGGGGAGFADGQGTAARLNMPAGITVDLNGNLYWVERLNHAVRTIDTNGNVLTIAGTGAPGYKDGNRKEALFNSPEGIMWHKGNLYVSDTSNHCVRMIELPGGTNRDGAELSLTLKPALTIVGVAGTFYRIEVAEEAVSGAAFNWMPVATVQLRHDIDHWFDPQPPLRRKRFYRAVQLP